MPTKRRLYFVQLEIAARRASVLQIGAFCVRCVGAQCFFTVKVRASALAVSIGFLSAAAR